MPAISEHETHVDAGHEREYRRERGTGLSINYSRIEYEQHHPFATKLKTASSTLVPQIFRPHRIFRQFS